MACGPRCVVGEFNVAIELVEELDAERAEGEFLSNIVFRDFTSGESRRAAFLSGRVGVPSVESLPLETIPLLLRRRSHRGLGRPGLEVFTDGLPMPTPIYRPSLSFPLALSLLHTRAYTHPYVLFNFPAPHSQPKPVSTSRYSVILQPYSASDLLLVLLLVLFRSSDFPPRPIPRLSG